MLDKILSFFNGKKGFSSRQRFALILCGVALAFVWINGVRLQKEEAKEASSLVQSGEDEYIKMITVEIKGEVVAPGIYEVEENARAIDLIEMAGGITENADMEKVNQVDILKDGEMLRIPSLDEKKSSSGGSGKSTSPAVVNINTASAEEIAKITGVGASAAAGIVNYRNSNGRYNKASDLAKAGIPDSVIHQISNKILF